MECKDAPPPIDEKKKEEQQAPADGGTVNLEVASLEMQKLMSDFEEPDDKTLSPEQKRLMNQMTVRVCFECSRQSKVLQLSAKKLDSQRGLPVYTDKVEYSAEAVSCYRVPSLTDIASTFSSSKLTCLSFLSRRCRRRIHRTRTRESSMNISSKTVIR